jgi:hypothetical protein
LLDFLRRLTVAKKKNSSTEKALVSLLEKSVWLAGRASPVAGLYADVNSSPS